MALGTSWTTIASGSKTINGAVLTCYIEAKLNRQDASTKKSYIDTRLRTGLNSGASMSSYDYLFSCTGCTSKSGSGIWYFANETVLTGSTTVTHDNNGNGTLSMSGRCYGGGMSIDITPSGSIALPKMDLTPSAPTTCSASAGNGNYAAIGEPITITYSGASGTITGYELQRSINGGSWTNITSPDTLSTDVVSGSSVKYRVRAKNGSLASGWKESNTLIVSGKMNIKQNGSWVNGSPWIKVNGSWVRVKRVWKKVNGSWVQSK